MAPFSPTEMTCNWVETGGWTLDIQSHLRFGKVRDGKPPKHIDQTPEPGGIRLQMSSGYIGFFMYSMTPVVTPGTHLQGRLYRG